MGKKNTSILLPIILVILVIIVIAINIINRPTKKDVNEKISIVTSYDDFYTVNSCINRTLSYITTNDKKKLISVLDNNYKKDNKIDENNVLNYFKDISSSSVFSSKKMYYQGNDKNILIFYVYGIIKKDNLIDDNDLNNDNGIDYYFEVTLDKLNGLFSIKPITQEKWDGVNNE